MTRDEFNKKYGNTLFLKFNRHGYRLTNEEIAKLGYTVTGTATNNSTKTSTRSSISIGSRK